MFLKRRAAAKERAGQTKSDLSDEIRALQLRIKALEQESLAAEAEKRALEGRLKSSSAASSQIHEAYLHRLRNQTDSTVALSETVTSILGAVKEISVSYSEMLDAVLLVGATCRQLSDSFKAQVQTQQNIAGQIETAHAATQDEVRKAQALKQDLGQLESIRQFIATSADTIGEVSERLSILSVNGRIEAAHAGASGRGFAVVAQEMLNLQQESNKIITSQKAQLREFLPLMSTMQEKSDTVEAQAREQQASISAISAGNHTLNDQTGLNLERLSSLTSAVEELAASIELGKRTTAVIDEKTTRVEGIFNEEVFVSQKINSLDAFLFELAKKARSVAEAGHSLVNEYQKLSVLNGASYVWQAESWLVTWRHNLPAELRERYASFGDRVLVCIGQTDNNQPFLSPLDPRAGILAVRRIDEILNPESPLQSFQEFLSRTGLTLGALKDPLQIDPTHIHANMAVLEQFTGTYQKTMQDSIRQGRLVSSFNFGGAFSNGDVMINNFLSNFLRHKSDAEKFGMIGESMVLAFQSLVDSGLYWNT
ncbi:MAG: hypothetical protein HKM06_08235 [Spirochaetales bacterium]|nr:hypothetical protein [Spirochaetales bacterium]